MHTAANAIHTVQKSVTNALITTSSTKQQGSAILRPANKLTVVKSASQTLQSAIPASAVTFSIKMSASA